MPPKVITHKTIPRGSHAPHINFPDLFIDGRIEAHLTKIEYVLERPSVYTDIVLNLEKCRWFDIFPLTRLLALLCARRSDDTKLHILGPSTTILPYYYDYIQVLEKKIKDEKSSDEELEQIQGKIRWYSKDLPQLGSKGGAFLVGWGAFDILEDHCSECHWYTSREKEVSLGELKETYLFAYGAEGGSTALTSDRVWPFMAVYRVDQSYMLSRINGEELIAGALRRYARNPVIEDGIAANVFFFEPFENVFQHAFLSPSDSDMAVVAMRMTDWMFTEGNELRDQSRSLLSKLPAWQRGFIEHTQSPFMEIVVADSGRGIPDSILESLGEGIQSNVDDGSAKEPDIRSDAWSAIKYAFEPHTTRKKEPLPGRRGLAWLKEKMTQAGGAIQVQSNGGNYILVDMGSGLTELPKSVATPKSVIFNKEVISEGHKLRGTFVHMMFPLKRVPPKRPLPRFPRWRELVSASSLFAKPTGQLIHFEVPSELIGNASSTQWDTYLSRVESELAREESNLAVLDFARQNVTRVALEHFFDLFCKHPGLHGRLLAINCDRHLVSRLDTVDAIDRMKAANLVFPLFEPGLRMHWVGVSAALEFSLLKYFVIGPSEDLREIESVIGANAGYFVQSLGKPIDFSFSLAMVEELARSIMGDSLIASLKARNAVNEGRFILPNKKVVTTYIEPHQIFADSDIGNLLCNHLSTLLRWRYSRLSVTKAADVRVLTATRIGRDIAMRMPAAFPQKFFVYYDYHLVRPGKPRLSKYLAGRSVVIVVDIISTGSQVNELIRICEEAGAFVIGIISFIDFTSEQDGHRFRSRNDEIEHKTFKRLPQTLSDRQPGDIPVDKYTLSISPLPDMEKEETRDGSALMSMNRSLRMLEDCQALQYGHYELFGHHYEFVINMSRLLTLPSPELDEMLRACEAAILRGSGFKSPTAVVLYPDLSSAHILQGSLEKRLAIRRVLGSKLRFVEARRGSRARGRRYWLTKQELEGLRSWAQDVFPEGYSVLLLDDGASSGETLLALLDLARELKPARVAAFVLINRMPHLHTYHHREIERFAWAASNFECLLHLNIPVYPRDGCPLCHERAELAREFRHAKEEWFKRQIGLRLESFDLITSLSPQDVPEGPMSERLPEVEDAHVLTSESLIKGQTILTRAVSLRAAINDGVSIMEVFAQASEQNDDDLWRLTVIELARRVDLQQAQRAERPLRDALVKVIRGPNSERGIAALEALRFMRPEVLHPVLRKVVDATLARREVPRDRKLAELILFMRRVTSYRHLTSAQAFDEENLLERELDQAAARARLGTALRSAIDRINREWQGAPQPRMDLVSVIRELERILQVHRRLSHQLLYELSQYIGDERQVFDPRVSSALNDAVRAANLAKMFVQLLADTHKLVDESLHEAIDRAHNDARELRRRVLSHMNGIEIASFKQLRDIMERIQQDLCVTVGDELRGQLVNPAHSLANALQDLQSSRIPELAGIEVDSTLENHLSEGTLAIIDSALFQRIVGNLISNLRHAVDVNVQKVRAEIVLKSTEDQLGPQVSVRVKSFTQGSIASKPEVYGTMTAELLQSGEAYGVEQFVPDECKTTVGVPWDETWSFWRL